MFSLRNSFLTSLLVGLGLGLQPPSDAGPLRVVTTTTDLRSIVAAVGGQDVKSDCIGSGSEDPHFLAAKPSYMMMAHNADLWVRVGLELEIGYEGLILEGSRNQKIQLNQPGHLDASQGIIRLEVPTGKIDRSMGDIHPLGNPHYWTDPYNARVVANNIRERLDQLDPAHAADYDANCAAFVKKIDEAMFGPALVAAIGGDKLWELELAGKLDDFLGAQKLSDKLGGWVAKVRPFRGTKIVTYHRSWPYFANRFGFDVVEELEPKPGIPPSPGHLVKVIQAMQRDKVKVILMEPFYEIRAPEFVAAKTGAKVVVAANSVGGQDEAKDYVPMIDNVVNRVVNALKQ